MHAVFVRAGVRPLVCQTDFIKTAALTLFFGKLLEFYSLEKVLGFLKTLT